MESAALRILDAAANRAREGLRVMEDVARFALDDAGATAILKRLRHEVSGALGALPISPAALLASRNTPGDVGTSVSTEAEYARADLAGVAAAACKRVQEALRSLEEVSKTLPEGASVARRFEAARYSAYDAEKRLASALERRRRPTPFLGFRLCVLLTESLCRHHSWMDVARLAIEGGADCIQLREKGLDRAELTRRAAALVELAASWNNRPLTGPRRRVRIIVNDSPEVAIESGVDGVHLGQEDLSCAEAKALFERAGRPGMLVGVSTSRMEEALRAQRDGADYCGVGPMFASKTKVKERIAGPKYLREYLQHDPPLPPAVAISGVNVDSLEELIEVADRRPFGVAVSSAACGSREPHETCRAMIDSLRGDDWSSEYVDMPDAYVIPFGAGPNLMLRFTPAIQLLLDSALDRGDTSTAAELVHVGASCCFKSSAEPLSETLPDWVFNRLLALLEDPRALGSRVCREVARRFQAEWLALDAGQRTELLEALERALPLMKDEGAWFVVSELLGENYSDGRAFEATERLTSIEGMPARIFLPHAFEHIAKDSGDSELAAKSIERIGAMTTDADPEVAREARDSLARLARARRPQADRIE